MSLHVLFFLKRQIPIRRACKSSTPHPYSHYNEAHTFLIRLSNCLLSSAVYPICKSPSGRLSDCHESIDCWLALPTPRARSITGTLIHRRTFPNTTRCILLNRSSRCIFNCSRLTSRTRTHFVSTLSDQNSSSNC